MHFNITLPENFEDDIWTLIKGSPLLLIAFVFTFIPGYGISFLLFSYRQEEVKSWKWIHHFFGVCYVAVIYFLYYSKKIFYDPNSLTLDDLIISMPTVFLISYVLLFFTSMIVIIRERRGGN